MMGNLRITIVAATDPDENVHTHVEAVAMMEHEVRPTLDRALRALEAERKALEACPYHRLPAEPGAGVCQGSEADTAQGNPATDEQTQPLRMEKAP